MNVSERISTDAFSPYHGTEEMVNAAIKRNGAVYFAYDNRKIFFDVNGNRYQMSGNGILFVYGDTPPEELVLDPETALYPFPRENILEDHYLVGSIIINSDNTFYKIVQMDDVLAYCEKLLIAGGGGGGIGDGDGDEIFDSSILLSIDFPKYHPYGTKLIGKGKVTDARGGQSGTFTLQIYNNVGEYKEGIAPRFTKSFTVDVGDWFDIELNADDVVAGDQNYFLFQVEVDLRYSSPVTRQVTCVDVHYEPTNQWNPIALLKPEEQDVQYYYKVYAGQGSKLPDDWSINVVYTLTDGLSGLSYEVSDVVTSQSGAFKLNDLLSNVDQGGHTLDVHATMMVGTSEVVVGDYHYGIGVFRNITSGEKAVPIIWSPYNKTEEENYTIIKIPYNVYDPTRNDGKAYVEYYINGEEQIGVTVTYSEAEWQTWTIATYNVNEMNSFILQCGLTYKEFQVFIVPNYKMDLDATKGAVLYLNALGRSNLETPNKRQQWLNKAENQDDTIGLGEIKFNNFNWANNGWIEDESEGTCLRVSNGASVEIPLAAMSTVKAASRTYEFDFKVRNAIDYSRLIIEKAVQKVDANGNPMFDEDGTPETEQVKTVSSGEGAFLTYFNPSNYRGFMLGTQEAFFSLSKTKVVNARYTDDERVKISIVVDAAGKFTQIYNTETGAPTSNTIPLIYLYVNGVLTNIMKFTSNDDFSASVDKIVINSDYCDVDIFNIRVYTNALNYSAITQNWIGDAPTLDERHNRYNRNGSIVESNKIDYAKVRQADIIPTMVITTYKNSDVGATADNKLPYAKGNKKAVGIRFWNPAKPSQGFHCQNVELDVQGTSSQGYPRRNYKLKTKEKVSGITSWDKPFRFETWDGDENKKDYWYQDNKDTSKMISKIDIGNGIAANTFCLKADYMESSSTHNTQFANLIQTIANQTGSDKSADLRHPLKKYFGQTKDYRTTVFGFPILVFWEDVDGNIEYVGKYNFNLDKGATNTFGFDFGWDLDPAKRVYNPYSAEKIHISWQRVDELSDDEELREETEPRKSTFGELAECWEFCQNQSGLGKFQSDDANGFYELIPNTEENAGRLQIYNHFEPRYTYEDWDIGDVYKDNEIGVANQYIKDHTKNFKVMWDWVHSTDTTKFTGSELDTTKYYLTLSSQYEHGVTYYTLGADQTYTKANITPTIQAAYQTLNETDNANSVIVNNLKTFTDFLVTVNGTLTEEDKANGMTHDYEKYVGPYTFVKHEDGLFYYEMPEGSDQEAVVNCGLEISENYARDEFTIEVNLVWEGFSADLYEKFDTDSIRYRKAKFRNEFTEHFDLDYCAIYFIMTELLLCYDSRQKNMMIATWGPTAKSNANGDFIWFPIFYDIDTQLGVNNSGHVSWDYNTDATLVSEDPDIYDDTGHAFKDASIFSGAGSVLWINFAGLMMDKILAIYRGLRNEGAIELDTLNEHYNTNGSDKWSEIMKNIDADYKYISPATVGYTDQEGTISQTEGYFYCLQGDRTLNRQAFFRNRLNYLDSQWLGGSYNPEFIKKQIKLRYNANDLARTSDDTRDEEGNLVEGLQASASFNLHGYLSQYLSVVYDETATTPKPYVAGQDDPVLIDPPSSIKNRLDDGVPLSQQLAYIRGPEYIADLGDLSDKYLNEIDYSQAIRLRTFTLGSLIDGYRNDGITDKFIDALAITATSPKGLLTYMDLSNLTKLAGSLQLTGAEKINTFMATGTQLSSVEFTEGNLLKTLYLPETITSFVLKQPLELRGIVETAPTIDNTPTGLYIKNLTDKYTTTPNANTTCNIETFVLDRSKMGIDSYRLLDYLYKVKEAKHNGIITDGNTTSILKCDFTDVEWSPYKLVEIGTSFDRATKYYELKNQTTYEVYHDPNGATGYYEEGWINKLNDGVIYTFDDAFDTNVIKNLDIVTAFLDMYEDKTATVETDTYRYRSFLTYNELLPNTKILPGLTGRMHVNNQEEGDALDEYTLWKRYNALYPDLEITGDKVNPAYSVHFVEYNAEGVQKTLGWLKYPYGYAESPVVYEGEEPSRLHYDFVGWAIEDDTFDFRAAHSVITDSDKVTLYATDELNTHVLSAIDGGRVTVVAVYKVHGYTMSFYNYDGSLFEEIETPAGKPIITPTRIPQRDSTSLDLTSCYKFIGWHTSLTSSTDTTDLNRILAGSDMNFYAVYMESSVYDNVIDQQYLSITYKTDAVLGNYAIVGLDPTYGIGGKVCFPITVFDEQGVEWPILEIAAGTSATGSVSNGMCQNTDLYAVFFLGCQENAENLSKIYKFNDFAFDKATSLVHVDFPDSLTTIGTFCFRNCTNLVVDNTNNVSYFGNSAFANACRNKDCVVLTVPYNEYSLGDTNNDGIEDFGAAYGNKTFQNCGWSIINFGTAQRPINANALTWLSTNAMFGASSQEYLSLSSFVVTYDNNSTSYDEILSYVDDWIANYDLHITANPNLVQIMQA